MVTRTAKQQRAGSGRPRRGANPNRVVPLSNPAYVDELRRLFTSVRQEFETDSDINEHYALPVLTVSDPTVQNLINRAIAAATRASAFR